MRRILCNWSRAGTARLVNIRVAHKKIGQSPKHSRGGTLLRKPAPYPVTSVN